MRRSLVTVNVVLVLSLFSAALLAQTPPTQQTPPAQQQPAAQQPAAPKEPRMPLSGEAGMFLYQIKPAQGALFEELITKVKESLLKSENPVRKQQSAGLKFYKAAEPMGGNALYVILADPALKATEYDLILLVNEGFGAQAGTPENQELLKKYLAVFAAAPSRLNLTPIGK